MDYARSIARTLSTRHYGHMSKAAKDRNQSAQGRGATSRTRTSFGLRHSFVPARRDHSSFVIMNSRHPATTLTLLIPRELARKITLLTRKNNAKIIIDGSLNLALPWLQNQCPMPNSHSPDKEPLSLQIPRPVMGRLKRKAKQSGIKLTDLVITILTAQTNDITLTSKDYEAIARATKQAEKTRKRCATLFDDTP